jgi:hypothetical protein
MLHFSFLPLSTEAERSVRVGESIAAHNSREPFTFS